MKKRTKLEVIRDILIVLKENREVRITHLIYKSNLSNNSIKPHIKELLKKELIIEKETKKGKFYELTKKGNEFLEEFNKIKVFSETYGF